MTMISLDAGAWTSSTNGQFVPVLLELFNGGSVILEGVFMLWALRYLWTESRRRNLRPRDWWFGLPPSMSFIVAVVVFDSGSWVRSLAVWSWRRFYHSGEFAPWHLFALLIAAAVGLVGALCKIRAVTQPDYGNEPWLVCLALTVLFIGFSIFVRLVFPG